MIQYKKLSSQYFLLIVILLIANRTFCQKNVCQTKIKALTESSFYTHTNIGVSARNIQTNELLIDINKDKMFNPASILKVITTFVGLEILGDSSKFTTLIAYDGDIDSLGVLHGNIYLIGSGDPTFASDRFSGGKSLGNIVQDIISATQLQGIKSINGKIIADESTFDSFPVCPSWQWNDLGNYYASGAWGLNVNENQYSIYFQRNKEINELAPVAYISPFVPNLDFLSEVTIAAPNSGDNTYIFGGPYHYGKRAVGTIPQGSGLYRIRGSLPDPPMFLAYNVYESLTKSNIQSEGYTTKFNKKSPSNLSTMLEYSSPALDTIALYANRFSINLYCESILKKLGQHLSDNPYSTLGIDAIKNYLQSAKINTKGIHMEDGSGLSARNLLSPDVMTSVLVHFANSKGLNKVKNRLPLAGKEGTVKSLLLNSPAKLHVWCKSGSMSKTLSYTGFIDTKSGTKVAFTAIINGSANATMAENKAELEKIIDAMYRFL